MKSQKHNEGELVELTVKIEKELAESLDTMAENSGISIDELVATALKRFKVHHADYMGTAPDIS